MKKIFIITIIVTSLLLSSCNQDKEIVIKKNYSTWVVFSGAINLNNSYIWYIKWKDTVNLSPKIGGRITNIYVKEWDYVEKWVLLAKLDSLEPKTWYSSAINIIKTLNNIKRDTSILFDKQIKQTEENIKQLNTLKKWSKNTIIDTNNITDNRLESMKISVDIAKSTLENTNNILQIKKDNIYKNSKSAIVWSIILDINIINFSDSLLWVTDKNKNLNNSFKTYLSAKNTSFLKQAETKFIKANKLYLDYKKYYDENIDWKKPNKEIILIWLNKWEKVAEELKTLLSIIYNVLDNSIENVYFTLNTINNYKTKISTFWTDIESSLLTVSWNFILWLKWSYQSLTDFEQESNMKILLLEKQLSLAKSNYEEYLATKKWQIRWVKIKSDIANDKLAEITYSLSALKKQKAVALNEIQAKIEEANRNKNIQWIMINNWKIFSPINWIITQKNSEVWQVVQAWSKILQVADNENLKINIELSENDLKNINLFDDILLEVEWINKQILWKVTNIWKSKNIITKKTKIEISINNKSNNIKIWSFTKVLLNKTFKNNEIIIPNSAIISRFMLPWVYILKNNKAQFKNIKIIKQNDNFSEVSWINTWDIIITKWKENISDWELLN